MEEILLFNKFFFLILDICLSCEDIVQESCVMRADGEFLRLVFSVSRM